MLKISKLKFFKINSLFYILFQQLRFYVIYEFIYIHNYMLFYSTYIHTRLINIY